MAGVIKGLRHRPWGKPGIRGRAFMEVLLPVSRAIDALNEKVGQFCDYLILIVCFISGGNAIMRYLFSYSSNAFLEIQWYLFGAIVLLGASYTLKRNEHVRVDVLYANLSERGRLMIDAIGFLFFMLPVMVFLIYLSLPVFLRSFANGELSQNAGGLILWPAKLLLPLGFFLLTLQGISELIKRFAALEGVIELETKYEKPLQ